jgi:hypothetical protein
MKRFAVIGASVTLFVLALAGSGISGEKDSMVKYPEGYRGWTHVKSMVIEEGHPLHNAFGGIHHVYANKKALDGLEKNNYRNGAVFVFDLLEASKKDNAVTEGARKVVGVMEKDHKKFPSTGGWGFEAFKGDTTERAVKDQKADCFACHETEKQTDFVFSKYRK